jgi:uncharacterized OB-fold protein
MIRRVALRETLFTVPEAPDAPPALLCGRCRCGHVFFPAQRLGCERCGAHGDDIRIVEVPAQGVLRTFATAWRPRPAAGESPMVVGTVMLDAGPAFEVTLAAREEELRVGQRVHGVLVESARDDAGQVLMDCRFAPDGPA